MGDAYGRLTEWAIVSRWRYGLVQGVLNWLVFMAVMMIIRPIPFPRVLLLMATALCVSVLSQALIWYPRAKRRFIEQQG